MQHHSSDDACGVEDEVPMNVFLHIDADCFYAAVECKRLGIDGMKEPLACVQWDGLIAVSYKAREFGVKRGDCREEARAKCPSIIFAEVEYIPLPGLAPAVDLDQSNAKVSLRRYRQASREVLSVISKYAVKIERASIDECFVDVTSEARGAELCDSDDADVRAAWVGTTTTDGALLHEAPQCMTSSLLRGGALTAARIRLAVRRETGYTVSCGIAFSKMLAKIGSSHFKPNRQTAVRPSAVPRLMAMLRLRDMNGFRGKRGKRVVEALGEGEDVTAGAVLALPEAEIARRLGSEQEARGLRNVCCGSDKAKVRPNLQPKSINCFKSFASVSRRAELENWIRLLAAELAERVEEDAVLNHRRPTCVTLGHRGELTGFLLTPMRSKSCRVGAQGALSSGRLFALAIDLLSKFGSDGLPCSRIQLSASGFVDRAFNGIDSMLRRQAAASVASVASTASAVASSSSSMVATGRENNDVDGIYSICKECGARVAIHEYQVHKDYHVALELQRGLSRLVKGNEKVSGHKRSPQQGIRKFFTAKKVRRDTASD